MFGKRKSPEFQFLELPKFLISMFGKAKIHDSSVWKRKSAELQCFAEPKFLIPMIGKASNKEFQCLEKSKIKEFQCL